MCGQEENKPEREARKVMRHRGWGLEQDMEKQRATETSARGETDTGEVCAHVGTCSSAHDIVLSLGSNVSAW